MTVILVIICVGLVIIPLGILCLLNIKDDEIDEGFRYEMEFRFFYNHR